jgi:flagellar P-ring protein FlgI
MKSILRLLILLSTININCYGQTRIKDIASFEGVRENFLVGQGLVVGLNGTGDNLRNSIFTEKKLIDLLEKLRINVQGNDNNLKTKNIASVTVTASLPAFARQGSKIDVRVSTIGDARSLRGGILIPTPLIGPDGRTYVIATGPVSVSEFKPVSNDVKTQIQNIETNGIVQSGGIVETEVDFTLGESDEIRLALNSSDFTTANSIADSINSSILGNTASAIDSGTIKIKIPKNRKQDLVQFMSEIEQIMISPDYKAKIIISESTGTIVIGNNVQIRPVAIAQGNLVINVSDKIKQMNSSSPLLQDRTRDRISKGIDLKRGSELHSIENGSSLSDLVDGLNKLGVYPRDIINILYNMKNVGALDAVIEVVN